MNKKSLFSVALSAAIYSSASFGLSPPPTTPRQSIATLQVVIGYNQDYVDVHGGHSQARERINFLIQEANRAYERSEANVRIEAVSIIPVDYSGIATNRDSLPRLILSQADSEGRAGEQLALERARTGADIAGIVRPFITDLSRGCDSAYLSAAGGNDMSRQGRTAMFAIHDGGGRACPTTTLAHALAHLMGQEHDPGNALNHPLSAHHTFGFGHRGVASDSVGGGFVDIMGIANEGDRRAPYFSNPRLTTQCFGSPCGVENVSDTVRSMNITAPIVAEWARIGGGVRRVPFAEGTFDVSFVYNQTANLINPVYEITQWAPVVGQFIQGPGQDLTPEDPFDGGLGTVIRHLNIPANPTPNTVRVEVEALTEVLFGGNFRIYGGVGVPSLQNAICQETSNGTASTCRFTTNVPAGSPAQTAWVAVQRLNAVGNTSGYIMIVEDSVLPLTASPVIGLGNYVVRQGERITIRYPYQFSDATFIANDPEHRRYRYKAVWTARDRVTGSVISSESVTLERQGNQYRVEELTATPSDLVVWRNTEHNDLFFRVGSGVPQGTVKTIILTPKPGSSFAGTEVFLVPPTTPIGQIPTTESSTQPSSHVSREEYTRRVAPTHQGNNLVFTINQQNRTAGTWRLIVRGSPNTDVFFEAKKETQAPSNSRFTPQFGHYYNPSRSGHGFFLESTRNPINNEWVLIWYTYNEDGTPTWYYAQSQAPSSGAYWTAPLYRARWNSITNTGPRDLTAVGQITLHPEGDGALSISYQIQGREGAEGVRLLGTFNCPSDGQRTLPLSGLYFNPNNPGYGYSIQTEPGVEVAIGYVFDRSGNPRWFYSQGNFNPSFSSSLGFTAESLNGTCPTCFYQPNRLVNTGTYNRRWGNLNAPSIDRVDVTVAWQNPEWGLWETPDANVSRLMNPSWDCRTN